MGRVGDVEFSDGGLDVAIVRVGERVKDVLDAIPRAWVGVQQDLWQQVST